MASITKIRNKVAKINFNEAIEEAVYERQKPLVSLQQDQMLHGLRSNGGKIGKYKSLAYARKKYALNTKAGFGFIDLRLKREFQGDIFVDIRDKSVVFTSGDSKTQKLVGEYGDNIFGLNESRRKLYSQRFLKPVAIRKIKNQILK